MKRKRLDKNSFRLFRTTWLQMLCDVMECWYGMVWNGTVELAGREGQAKHNSEKLNTNNKLPATPFHR